MDGAFGAQPPRSKASDVSKAQVRVSQELGLLPPAYNGRFSNGVGLPQVLFSSFVETHLRYNHADFEEYARNGSLQELSNNTVGDGVNDPFLHGVASVLSPFLEETGTKAPAAARAIPPVSPVATDNHDDDTSAPDDGDELTVFQPISPPRAGAVSSSSKHEKSTLDASKQQAVTKSSPSPQIAVRPVATLSLYPPLLYHKAASRRLLAKLDRLSVIYAALSARVQQLHDVLVLHQQSTGADRRRISGGGVPSTTNSVLRRTTSASPVQLGESSDSLMHTDSDDAFLDSPLRHATKRAEEPPIHPPTHMHNFDIGPSSRRGGQTEADGETSNTPSPLTDEMLTRMASTHSSHHHRQQITTRPSLFDVARAAEESPHHQPPPKLNSGGYNRVKRQYRGDMAHLLGVGAEMKSILIAIGEIWGVPLADLRAAADTTGAAAAVKNGASAGKKLSGPGSSMALDAIAATTYASGTLHTVSSLEAASATFGGDSGAADPNNSPRRTSTPHDTLNKQQAFHTAHAKITALYAVLAQYSTLPLDRQVSISDVILSNLLTTSVDTLVDRALSEGETPSRKVDALAASPYKKPPAVLSPKSADGSSKPLPMFRSFADENARGTVGGDVAHQSSSGGSSFVELPALKAAAATIVAESDEVGEGGDPMMLKLNAPQVVSLVPFSQASVAGRFMECLNGTTLRDAARFADSWLFHGWNGFDKVASSPRAGAAPSIDHCDYELGAVRGALNGGWKGFLEYEMQVFLSRRRSGLNSMVAPNKPLLLSMLGVDNHTTLRADDVEFSLGGGSDSKAAALGSSRSVGNIKKGSSLTTPHGSGSTPLTTANASATAHHSGPSAKAHSGSHLSKVIALNQELLVLGGFLSSLMYAREASVEIHGLPDTMPPVDGTTIYFRRPPVVDLHTAASPSQRYSNSASQLSSPGMAAAAAPTASSS